ncbi:MAG: cation-transporting P-type ATPase [Deinococcales bacterium]
MSAPELAPPGSAGAAAAERPASPWSVPAEAVLRALDVDAAHGLEAREVAARLARYGPNALREPPRRRAWQILLAQFESVLAALLLAAALVSAVFGQWIEALAVLVVLALNAAIGFVTELRAVRSMEALRSLGRVHATVRRDGALQTVEAEALVPGDVLVVEGGDVITADVRLSAASKLQANESALTGESLPVTKTAPPVSEDAPLAERRCMLFKGTSITRGSGEGVVVATGMDTELGRISELVSSAEDQTTPLEERLNRLGQRLVWVTLAVAALVAATGLTAGKSLPLILETAIALAVATVPEGLPIIATITLARGMRRMAERNALVNRLSAVETLGATSVIFTDKTGTLTENRLAVEELWLERGRIRVAADADARALARPELREALEVAVLCNNASLGEALGRGVGDPLEVALLEAASRGGVTREALLEEQPEVREEAFDPDVKMMATVHRRPDEGPPSYRVAVKGAPESVIDACTRVAGEAGNRELDDEARATWLQRNHELAAGGLRVLALAGKRLDDLQGEPYRDLTLLALVALRDPPRRDVKAAIDGCRSAGVRVVMVTGDQPVTALSVARSVGLSEGEPRVVAGRDVAALLHGDAAARARLFEADVLARVSPEQKLALIRSYQESGAIVAMTGDGVNDAPALKRADIGVAMGLRGTEVAREAADMVLKDDAFGTIVEAVRQGRIIFDDIRTFVVYLLSCNLSEILVIGLASAWGAPLPLLPLQILFLNLVTDVFPALALGAGEGAPGVLQRRPRDPREPVLARRHWWTLSGYATLITLAVLGAFALALGPLTFPRTEAVTVSFLTLAFAQLWHVFDMREPGSGALRNEVTRNPWVWASLALCTALLLGAVALPGARDVLTLAWPSLRGWLLVLVASLAPTLIGQLGKGLGLGRVA